MECKEYSELISAYVDEMLSPQEEQLLRTHLERCERCNQEVRVIKEMKEMCGQLGEAELPADFHQDLMKKIKSENQVKAPISLRWKWQYGGALVATAMIGFLALNKIDVLQSGQNMTAESGTVPYATASNDGEQQKTAKSYITQETEAGVISAENGSKNRTAQMQESSVSWQVTISDLDTYEAELSEYLEREEIDFEVTNGQFSCYEVKEAKQFKEWIQNHGGSFKGELPSGTSDIKINLILSK